MLSKKYTKLKNIEIIYDVVNIRYQSYISV